MENHPAEHDSVAGTENSLGLGLPGLNAQFADVDLTAAPPAWPDGVLLPTQLHNHQVAHVHVGGDEEGHGGVAGQHRPVGGQAVRRSVGQLHDTGHMWYICGSVLVYSLNLESG